MATAVHTLFADAQPLLGLIGLRPSAMQWLQKHTPAAEYRELCGTVVAGVPEEPAVPPSREAALGVTTAAALVRLAGETLAAAGRTRSILAHGWVQSGGGGAGIGGAGGRAVQRLPNTAADYLCNHRGWSSLVRACQLPDTLATASGAQPLRRSGAASAPLQRPLTAGLDAATLRAGSVQSRVSEGCAQHSTLSPPMRLLMSLLCSKAMVFVPAGDHGCYWQVAGTPFSVVLFGRRAAALRDRNSARAAGAMARAYRRLRGRIAAARARQQSREQQFSALAAKRCRSFSDADAGFPTQPPAKRAKAETDPLPSPASPVLPAQAPSGSPLPLPESLEPTQPIDQSPPAQAASEARSPWLVPPQAVLARASAAAAMAAPPVSLGGVVRSVVRRSAFGLPPSSPLAAAAKRISAGRRAHGTSWPLALTLGAQLAAGPCFATALVTTKQRQRLNRALAAGTSLRVSHSSAAAVVAALPPRLRQAARLLGLLLLRLAAFSSRRALDQLCPEQRVGRQVTDLSPSGSTDDNNANPPLGHPSSPSVRQSRADSKPASRPDDVDPQHAAVAPADGGNRDGHTPRTAPAARKGTASRPAMAKPGPIACAQPLAAVQQFLCAAVRAVVPAELAGGRAGRRALLGKVAALPALGRGRELPGEWAWAGVPATAWGWAAPPGLARGLPGSAVSWGEGGRLASLLRGEAAQAGAGGPRCVAASADAACLPPAAGASSGAIQGEPAAAGASSAQEAPGREHGGSNHLQRQHQRQQQRGRRRPPCDAMQNRLCHITCAFVVHFVALPMLKACFHVTEAEGVAGRPLLFFRRRDWTALEGAGFEATRRRLALVRLRGEAAAAAAAETQLPLATPGTSASGDLSSPGPPLPVAGGAALRPLGFGPLRLVPKRRGMRPIVNLSLPMSMQRAPAARMELGAAAAAKVVRASSSALQGSAAKQASVAATSLTAAAALTRALADRGWRGGPGGKQLGQAGMAAGAAGRMAAGADDGAAAALRCMSVKPPRHAPFQASFADASVNAKLASARHALASALKASPIASGAAVDMLSAASIHRGLRCFRALVSAARTLAAPPAAPAAAATAPGTRAALPGLQAASADVHACYDTIPHRRLARMIPAALASGLRGDRAAAAAAAGASGPGAPACLLRTVSVCRREAAVLAAEGVAPGSAAQRSGSGARTAARRGPFSSLQPPPDSGRLAGPIGVVRQAASRLDCPSLLLPVALAGASLRHTVVCESLAAKRFHAADTSLLLRAHVEQSQLSFGGRVWQQRRGIPQGSSVSGLLCTAHYAGVDEAVVAPAALLGAAKAGAGSGAVTPVVVLRLLDDFLVVQGAAGPLAPRGSGAAAGAARCDGDAGASATAIGEQLAGASGRHSDAGDGCPVPGSAPEAAVAALTCGHKGWGCVINPGKTRHWHEVAGEGGGGEWAADRWFAWCGLLLGAAAPGSLAARVDWSRLAEHPAEAGSSRQRRGAGTLRLSAALLDASVAQAAAAGGLTVDGLVTVVRRATQRRALSLLFDRQIQAAHVVAANVAEAGAVAAARCLVVVQAAGLGVDAAHRVEAGRVGRQASSSDVLVAALGRLASAIAAAGCNNADRRTRPQGGDGGAAARSCVRRGAQGGAVAVLGGDGLVAWPRKGAAETLVAGEAGAPPAWTLEPGGVCSAPLLSGDLSLAATGGAAGSDLSDDDSDGDSDDRGGRGGRGDGDDDARSRSESPSDSADCDSEPPSPTPSDAGRPMQRRHWRRGPRKFASAVAVQLSRDCRFGDGMPLPWLDLTAQELRLAALSGMDATLDMACRRKPAAASPAAPLVRAVSAAHARVRGLRDSLRKQLEDSSGQAATSTDPIPDSTGVPLEASAHRLAAVLRGACAAQVTARHLFWP